MADEAEKKDAQQTELKKGLALQRIYIKDVSFEGKGAPEYFRKEWQPEVKLDLHTQSTLLENDIHEVVLTLTVAAMAEKDTVFLVEIKQAGIFSINGFADEELKYTLGSFCPGVLYPYAREVVTDLVSKASFPQLLLAPVNFDALYRHHLQQGTQEANAEEGAADKAKADDAAAGDGAANNVQAESGDAAAAAE